jgi:hypothetical protein
LNPVGAEIHVDRMVATARPRCLAMISASWCRRLKKSAALRGSISPATRRAVAAHFWAAVLAAARLEPVARRRRAAGCLPARVSVPAALVRACGR